MAFRGNQISLCIFRSLNWLEYFCCWCRLLFIIVTFGDDLYVRRCGFKGFQPLTGVWLYFLKCVKGCLHEDDQLVIRRQKSRIMRSLVNGARQPGTGAYTTFALFCVPEPSRALGSVGSWPKGSGCSLTEYSSRLSNDGSWLQRPCGTGLSVNMLR